MFTLRRTELQEGIQHVWVAELDLDRPRVVYHGPADITVSHHGRSISSHATGVTYKRGAGMFLTDVYTPGRDVQFWYADRQCLAVFPDEHWLANGILQMYSSWADAPAELTNALEQLIFGTYADTIVRNHSYSHRRAS